MADFRLSISRGSVILSEAAVRGAEFFHGSLKESLFEFDAIRIGLTPYERFDSSAAKAAAELASFRRV